jgi:hypothetical protein
MIPYKSNNVDNSLLLDRAKFDLIILNSRPFILLFVNILFY